MFRQFQLWSRNPCNTPNHLSTPLTQTPVGPIEQYDTTLYQNVICSILSLFLATRPYLSPTFPEVSQFSRAPSIDHPPATHHIIHVILQCAFLYPLLTRCSAVEDFSNATALTNLQTSMTGWNSEIASCSDSDCACCLSYVGNSSLLYYPRRL